jgi:biopolymer transport protein ExbB
VRGVLVTVVLWGCSFQHGKLPSDGGGDGTMGSGDGRPPDAVSPEWAFRRTLTIDNAGNGALSDFAIAVILDGTRITYGATAAQGADLRFTDASSTGLAYEIERWDPAGRSIVWVRVPSIPAGATTTITMHYGNPMATPGANPAAVWDNDFTGVWHLVDGHDSTGRSTSSNMGATSIPGQIGPALDFSGAAQYVDTGNSDHLTRWTIEAWMNPATASAATGASSVISRFPNYMILWSCNGVTFCHKVMYDGSAAFTHVADYTVAVGAWSHVVGRYDGASLRAYVAGTMVGQELTTDTPTTTTVTAKIGTRMDLLGDFDGGIDEVRISRVARSEDYIRAQVRSTTDAYITYGAEQAN